MILAGVRAVTIHDKQAVQLPHLSAQFYLNEEDVGKNRAEACKDQLQELNTAVNVSASAADLDAGFLKQFQVCGHICGIHPPARALSLSVCVRGCPVCMQLNPVPPSSRHTGRGPRCCWPRGGQKSGCPVPRRRRQVHLGAEQGRLRQRVQRLWPRVHGVRRGRCVWATAGLA